MPIYYRKDFDKEQNNGGQTGSIQTRNEGSNWIGQLKFSILADIFPQAGETVKERATRKWNRYKRQIKVGFLDVENFGELIGAKVAYSLAGNEAAELVPEVSFVVDDQTKQVGVVSKYLYNVQGTLLEDRDTQFFVKEEGPPKHPLSKSEEISLVQKKGICKAIALSIMVGDHDINPGNMLKIKGDKIARIDYGHAFNDMLSQSKIFGGQVRNKNNQVLDFFNRERVNTIKLGDSTKLWRSYENLIPSQEMVQAMKEMAEGASKIIVGVAAAKEDFENLLKVEGVDKKHILKSLAAVANNLEGKKIKIDIKNPQKTLDEVFTKIKTFSQNQVENMDVTAELMKFQLRLDLKKPIDQVDIDKFNEMATKENGLRNWRGKINWIKTSKDEPAFVGSIEDYLKKSGLNKEEIKNMLPPKPSFMDRAKKFIQSLRSGHSYEPATTRDTLVEMPDDLKNLNNKEADELRKAFAAKQTLVGGVYVGRYSQSSSRVRS